MLLHSHTEPLDKASISQRLPDGPDVGEVPISPSPALDQQLGFESNPTGVGKSRIWLPAKIGEVSLESQGTLSASHQTMRQRCDTRPLGEYHKSMILHYCEKMTGGSVITPQWGRGKASIFLVAAVGLEVFLYQNLVSVLEFWIRTLAIPVGSDWVS